jgi:SAM-dependent methyltransferase
MDWSRVRAGRARAYELLPPLAKARLIAGGEVLIRRHLKDGDHVLDVGAHDRRIERWLKSEHRTAAYRSLDVDRSLPHDYYDFADVDESFDMVTVLDVVEHVAPEVVHRMMEDSFRVLKPGGRIVVTTPNVSHPVRLWRDCTHITAMHHAELCGFLLSAGFTAPELSRVREMNMKDWLLYALAWPTLKLLEVDFAFGIAMTAVKPR